MWTPFLLPNLHTMKKICLVSSCGGHFMELMQLLPAVSGLNFYIITEKNVASYSILKKYKHHYLLQQERKGWAFIFKFTYNILASLYFLIVEHPSTIITTGAGAAYPTCRLGKFMGCKVIYIESFAKLNSSSVTGKMIYPFADYFFVQWSEMQQVYPNAIYKGQVY